MKNILRAACIVTMPALVMAADQNGSRGDALVDRLLDKIVSREAAYLDAVRTKSPLMETYIQETIEPGEGAVRPGEQARADSRSTDSHNNDAHTTDGRPIDLRPADLHPSDLHPTRDHYFLGRFRLDQSVQYEPLVGRSDTPAEKTPLWRRPFRMGSSKSAAMSFLPRGFAQMTAIDLDEFNRQTYHFEYVRREFLGEVRCLVFDVAPINRTQAGKFVGRIWVEDRDYSIVRFNGTYVPLPAAKGANPEMYFHFDSWRANTADGIWVPAQVYVEEEGTTTATGKKAMPRFKAQSRIWDYAAAPANKLEELTKILIESESDVKDAENKDVSPLESQRSWEKQAEENLLARLEKGGLLAPPGAVDNVLDTVVSNLIFSANLNIEAHCRVLLTSPIETFAIGHTIVISRGLIDVLPDEASLALMLAGELSHIALGHRTQTQFAFNNQTMLSDAELLQRFRFARATEEMVEAGKKTIEIMKASPYQKTANAGLFLKALASRSSSLPMLLKANLGDQVADSDALSRLADFAASAPPLEDANLEQIAALPLGSRVKMNPWNNQIELVKSRPISLLSPREKMPFEVTPFVLNLTRADQSAKDQALKGIKKTEVLAGQ